MVTEHFSYCILRSLRTFIKQAEAGKLKSLLLQNEELLRQKNRLFSSMCSIFKNSY